MPQSFLHAAVPSVTTTVEPLYKTCLPDDKFFLLFAWSPVSDGEYTFLELLLFYPTIIYNRSECILVVYACKATRCAHMRSAFFEMKWIGSLCFVSLLYWYKDNFYVHQHFFINFFE